MEILIPFIKVIHIIVCVFLIVLVLLQPGKGGDLGSVFGGGSSDSVFGSSGAGNFMTKTTTILATVFFIMSIVSSFKDFLLSYHFNNFRILAKNFIQHSSNLNI